MKIGIITFHWATNYGAIMQTYALQKYLQFCGHEVEIIDYRPRLLLFKMRVLQLIHSDKQTFTKEKNLKNFRKEHLNLTKKFGNNCELEALENTYDVVICGSDQIWNPSFTMNAEGKVTLSYYLNFTNTAKKIAYAVSFGTEQLPQDMINCIYPEIKQFSMLSARENSGVQILKNMGFEAQLVLDPTLLLEGKDYLRFVHPESKHIGIFSYILHENQNTAYELFDLLSQQKSFQNKENIQSSSESLTEWLSNIYHAEFVVTNSFHGTVFSILFHKPFLVVPVENSGMNDRIETLLSGLNLLDRYLLTYNEQNVMHLLAQDMDWQEVENLLKQLRKKSKLFLENSLNN